MRSPGANPSRRREPRRPREKAFVYSTRLCNGEREQIKKRSRRKAGERKRDKFFLSIIKKGIERKKRKAVALSNIRSAISPGHLGYLLLLDGSAPGNRNHGSNTGARRWGPSVGFSSDFEAIGKPITRIPRSSVSYVLECMHIKRRRTRNNDYYCHEH